MNTESTAIAERSREVPPIVKLNQQLEQRAEEFKKALPSHISPEKLQRTILTAAQNNPDLLLADRPSLITAAMKAAQDGLLPDGREAAFVIFGNREKDPQTGEWVTVKVVQYMPMVYGLRKKILQSGEISSLSVNVVYRAEVEQGRFVYEEGTEAYLRHKPSLDLTDEELADENIVAAYSIARMKDGTIDWDVMRRSEINKVRQVSQTGAVGRKVKFGRDKGKEIEPKGPWVDWFAEMAKKTVMRRHSKTLPMSGDIIVDVEGREIEIAARAASVLDSVEPDAPKVLPGRDELGEEQFDERGEQVDEATGEVTTDSRGMTEVDEETARQLDNESAGDEPADEDPVDESPADTVLRNVKEQIEAAKNPKGLGVVEAEWVNKHRIAFDDDTAAEIDRLINAKRKALSTSGESGQ